MTLKLRFLRLAPELCKNSRSPQVTPPELFTAKNRAPDLFLT